MQNSNCKNIITLTSIKLNHLSFIPSFQLYGCMIQYVFCVCTHFLTTDDLETTDILIGILTFLCFCLQSKFF